VTLLLTGSRANVATAPTMSNTSTVKQSIVGGFTCVPLVVSCTTKSSFPALLQRKANGLIGTSDTSKSSSVGFALALTVAVIAVPPRL
jgi:hypothetical protein